MIGGGYQKGLITCFHKAPTRDLSAVCWTVDASSNSRTLARPVNLTMDPSKAQAVQNGSEHYLLSCF